MIKGGAADSGEPPPAEDVDVVVPTARRWEIRNVPLSGSGDGGGEDDVAAVVAFGALSPLRCKFAYTKPTGERACPTTCFSRYDDVPDPVYRNIFIPPI